MEFSLFEELKSLLEIKPLTIVFLVILVLLAVILIIIGKSVKFNARILAYGAICIAASFILSYMKLFQMPNGGSITIASMLPLILFSYIFGFRAGFLAGIVYGMLQYMQEPYFLNPVQFLLDYPVPFALIAVSGLFKNLYFGAFVGVFARFISHFISGIVFYGIYAPEGQSPAIYSLIYNGSYLLPDLAITLIILAIPAVYSMVLRLKNETSR
jgi:thiamine transporter